MAAAPARVIVRSSSPNGLPGFVSVVGMTFGGTTDASVTDVSFAISSSVVRAPPTWREISTTAGGSTTASRVSKLRCDSSATRVRAAIAIPAGAGAGVVRRNRTAPRALIGALRVTPTSATTLSSPAPSATSMNARR